MGGTSCQRAEEVVVDERRDFISLYAVLIVAGIVVFLVAVVVLNQRS